MDAILHRYATDRGCLLDVFLWKFKVWKISYAFFLSFDFFHINHNVGCALPGLKKKYIYIYIYFPSTKVYRKNYTENISLIEQLEH